MESTRAKESAVKKETAEQLELFRRQREEAEKAAKLAGTDQPADDSETWTVKKRKRGREKEALAVKLRKSSSSNSHPPNLAREVTKEPLAQEKSLDALPTPKATELKPVEASAPAIEATVAQASKSPTPASEKSPPPAAVLGLGGYSSDEE